MCVEGMCVCVCACQSPYPMCRCVCMSHCVCVCVLPVLETRSKPIANWNTMNRNFLPGRRGVCVWVGMGQSYLHSKASLCLWKQRSKSVANSNSCYVLGGVCASVKVHTKVSMCLCVELCACTSCVGEVSVYQVYRCYLYLCSQLKCCEQNFLFWVGSQINCFLCMRSSLSTFA